MSVLPDSWINHEMTSSFRCSSISPAFRMTEARAEGLALAQDVAAASAEDMPRRDLGP